MSAHTPGPWVIDPDKNDQLCVYGSGGFWIALLPHQCLGSIEEQQKINASLIAAAPELLDALKLAQRWLVNCVPVPVMHGPKPLPVIAAAIAKAEGR